MHEREINMKSNTCNNRGEQRANKYEEQHLQKQGRAESE